jgi:hypothetical protein
MRTVRIDRAQSSPPWERQALQQYSGLIQTARGAKRFLNTYRLGRAGLTSNEWDSFRELSGGPQEFRMAMLFLAVAAGQPSVARDWFLRLRNLDPDELPSGPQPGDNPRAWTAFYTQYHPIRTDTAGQFTPAQQEKWLARVERFTFWPAISGGINESINPLRQNLPLGFQEMTIEKNRSSIDRWARNRRMQQSANIEPIPHPLRLTTPITCSIRNGTQSSGSGRSPRQHGSRFQPACSAS